MALRLRLGMVATVLISYSFMIGRSNICSNLLLYECLALIGVYNLSTNPKIISAS